MRILVTYRINQYSQKMAGVWQKLLGQLEGFEQCGFDVYGLYMSYGTQILARFVQGNLEVEQVWQPIAVETEKQQFWHNAIDAADIVRPDVIYTRYDKMYDAPYLTLFAQSVPVQRSRLCLEFATYPYADEIQCTQKRQQDEKNRESMRPFIDLVFSTSLEKEILGLPNHHFTNQLSQTFINNASKSNQPLIAADGVMHIVSVANMSHWHGYDRLLKGLALYKSKNTEVKIHYHIVGHGDISAQLAQQVLDDELTDWVTFYGHKSFQDMGDLYDNASVCVGSLGLHRINIFDSCILKNREYLANGVPILSANKDKALENFPWVLNLPQDDSPIDVEAVIDFIQTCNQEPNIRQHIRTYARKELSWGKFCLEVKQANEQLLKLDVS